MSHLVAHWNGKDYPIGTRLYAIDGNRPRFIGRIGDVCKDRSYVVSSYDQGEPVPFAESALFRRHVLGEDVWPSFSDVKETLTAARVRRIRYLEAQLEDERRALEMIRDLMEPETE